MNEHSRFTEEDHLRGPHALLGAIVNSAMDAIVATDSRQNIVLFNHAAELLFGYQSDEIMGKPLNLLLPERFQTIHHKEVRAFGETGVTTRAMGELQPLAARRADGSEFPIEATIAQVVIDNERYYSAILRDITARNEAEEERRRVREREIAQRAQITAAENQRDYLQDVLDGLPGGLLLVTEPNSEIVFANSAFYRLNAQTSVEPRTMPVLDRDFALLRVDGLPLDPQDLPITRALKGERVRNQQLTMRRSDNTLVPVAAHGAYLHPAPGQGHRAIIVLQDVTQLRQAEQLKDDFLDLISHEFRTPLTAIHGGAHLLSKQGYQLGEDERAVILNDVVTETERLNQMLTNLLTVSNVLAGRLRADTEPVLLAPLARRAANGVDRRYPQHHFEIDITAGLPAVEADPSLLEQVLLNLYENAVKYSPEGGIITIQALADDTSVSLNVIDQGIGIAPELTGAVFERFRRVGGDPTVRGMGLGLYLSKHLIEAQNGTITAWSAGVGQGAMFTIRLPIAHSWHDPD